MQPALGLLLLGRRGGPRQLHFDLGQQIVVCGLLAPDGDAREHAGKGGAERLGATIDLLGLVVAAQRAQRIGHGKHRVGAARSRGDGPLEVVDAARCHAHLLVGAADIVEQFVPGGSELEGLFEIRQALLGAARIHQRIAEIVEDAEIGRLRSSRLLEEADGEIRLAGGDGEHPHAVEGVGIAGIAAQHGLVEPLGLEQPAARLEGHGLVDNLRLAAVSGRGKLGHGASTNENGRPNGPPQHRVKRIA